MHRNAERDHHLLIVFVNMTKLPKLLNFLLSVSVSPPELVPGRSGFHPEKEESVAGRVASPEQHY